MNVLVNRNVIIENEITGRKMQFTLADFKSRSRNQDNAVHFLFFLNINIMFFPAAIKGQTSKI